MIRNSSQAVALSSQVQSARCSTSVTTVLPLVRPLNYFSAAMWARESDCGSPSALELNVLVGFLWSKFLLLLLPSIQTGYGSETYVTVMIHE